MTAAAGGAARPGVDNLCGLLDRVAETADGAERVSLRDFLDHVGRRSYGPLLLFIGLFSISPATVLPGMTWFAAGLTLLIAGQMALGRPFVWMPRGALSASFSAVGVRKGIDRMRPWARRVDSVLKPRLCFLSAPPMVNLVALLCIAAALVTFPLGFIPFAPLAPGMAVVLFGLGMTARDGLCLILGAAPAAMAAVIAWPLLT